MGICLKDWLTEKIGLIHGKATRSYWVDGNKESFSDSVYALMPQEKEKAGD